ncbi:MAG TPA: EutN/CcmL family microcompartment protein [Candidatus Xenobia bacterium]|jgi:microcompartment protein CcmK/EutM
MFLGKVVGKAILTQKDPSLEGGKFLVVEPVNRRGESVGKPFVALDTVQAGQDDLVFLVKGREACIPWHNQFSPLDATIVGIVDGMATD